MAVAGAGEERPHPIAEGAWRIDYVLASPSAMKFLREAFIWPEFLGSDHCPVGVDLAPEVAGALSQP